MSNADDAVPASTAVATPAAGDGDEVDTAVATFTAEDGDKIDAVASESNAVKELLAMKKATARKYKDEDGVSLVSC